MKDVFPMLKHIVWLHHTIIVSIEIWDGQAFDGIIYAPTLLWREFAIAVTVPYPDIQVIVAVVVLVFSFFLCEFYVAECQIFEHSAASLVVCRFNKLHHESGVGDVPTGITGAAV